MPEYSISNEVDCPAWNRYRMFRIMKTCSGLANTTWLVLVVSYFLMDKWSSIFDPICSRLPEFNGFLIRTREILIVSFWFSFSNEQFKEKKLVFFVFYYNFKSLPYIHLIVKHSHCFRTILFQHCLKISESMNNFWRGKLPSRPDAWFVIYINL